MAGKAYRWRLLLAAPLAFWAAGAAAQGTAVPPVPAEERALSNDDYVDAATTTRRTAQQLWEAGRYGEAEGLYLQIRGEFERRFGPNDANTLGVVGTLAEMYFMQGDLAKAERSYQRLVTALQAGSDAAETRNAEANLARVYRDEGRYAEAEQLFARVLAGWEAAEGGEGRAVFAAVDLAGVHLAQGRDTDADRLYERYFAIQARAIEAHPDDTDLYANDYEGFPARQSVALLRQTLAAGERALPADARGPLIPVIVNLALALQRQGQFAEAEQLLTRAVSARQAEDGPDAPDTLTAVAHQGRLYLTLDRYADATRIAEDVLARRRALAAAQSEEDPEAEGVAPDRDTLAAMRDLALVYAAQGRFAEAQTLFVQALRSRPDYREPLYLETVTAAGDLAAFYRDQGRAGEADPLFATAAAGAARLVGRDSPVTLGLQRDRAMLLQATGDPAQAEQILTHVLAARVRALGPRHPLAIAAAGDLGLLYLAERRYAEAEPRLREALAGSEQWLGARNRATLVAAGNLARLLQAQGRYAEAAPLFRRAAEGFAAIAGASHPETLRASESLLTDLAQSPGISPDALDTARSLVRAQRERRQQGGAGQQAQMLRTREAAGAGSRFALFADIAWAGTAPAGRNALAPEVLTALQDAVAGPSDRAIAEQAGRRLAAGRAPDVAAIIVERQRLADQWTALDDRLAVAFGDSTGEDGDSPAALQQQMDQLQARMDAIDQRIRAAAPDYFALIQPQPVDLPALQAMLRPDEAILLVVPSRFGTHIMAVTNAGATWQRSDWTAERIGTAVQRLRWDAGARVSLSEAQVAEMGLARPEGAPPQFDRATAFGLYQQLVAPVLPSLRGRTRLFVAAGGALAGLPFSMLVSAAPAGSDTSPAYLRATHWLADDFQLTHIPSVQALALLRQRQAAGAGAHFVGIGNPALAPGADERSYGMTRGLTSSRQIFAHGRTRSGTAADVAALRAMPSLPGTGTELRMVQTTLNAPPTALHMGAAAGERAVRALDFGGAGLVLFSTHGLTAEEATGIGEPGLVLTPPAAPAAEGAEIDPADDGYLAASEVTTLNMDADWVVLSACNTATGDDNANLSALARAFFYAGARNLLASHWPVSDEVAPLLITRTVAPGQHGLSRGAALQQAMRSIRDDPAHPEWAHPFYWAPFVLIGDGAGIQ